MNERMTDRELLEAAARAAGITFSWINGGGAREDRKPGIMQPYVRWNPLESDGDALRLAVKLGMLAAAYRPWTYFYGEEVASGLAPYAATRRAIVRAAAAMAKEKA